ncbi:MAG: hypothetical protein ATN33_07470, partial [Epulopiscium sp. Nele67-Bin001]
MKDTIYTIPLTEAFQEKGECPFCFIYRKLEQDAISFTLGCSYMEMDFREQTDKAGFCTLHYQKLYDYGNRLGLCLILNTHYKVLYETINNILSENTLPTYSFFARLKKTSTESNSISTQIDNQLNSCFLCDRIEKDLSRYVSTFFYLWNKQSEFKNLYENSKGLCITHFSRLIKDAPLYLNEEQTKEFFELSKRLLMDSLKRIEQDLDWFIVKHDHNNKDKPWNNAQDAIPRAIQKLAG